MKNEYGKLLDTLLEPSPVDEMNRKIVNEIIDKGMEFYHEACGSSVPLERVAPMDFRLFDMKIEVKYIYER